MYGNVLNIEKYSIEAIKLFVRVANAQLIPLIHLISFIHFKKPCIWAYIYKYNLYLLENCYLKLFNWGCHLAIFCNSSL